ncbi:unnamed protein product, partial [Nesidiocoris tenuis]
MSPRKFYRPMGIAHFTSNTGVCLRSSTKKPAKKAQLSGTAGFSETWRRVFQKYSTIRSRLPWETGRPRKRLRLRLFL